VVTQGYRVAGTPNFPTTKKRARGRITVEPTRIFEYTGRLWDPDELLAAFSMSTASSQSAPNSNATGDEATLPHDRLELIRRGPAEANADRSALFHGVVGQLKRRHWTAEAITALLGKYPKGIAEKYGQRLRKEVERSYGKVGTAVSPSAGAAP